MSDDDKNEEQKEAWERRRERRRKRLHRRFRNSRAYHDPPPDPEDYEPESTWRVVLKTLWDNPTSLVLIAVLIALILYVFFSPVSLAVF